MASSFFKRIHRIQSSLYEEQQEELERRKQQKQQRQVISTPISTDADSKPSARSAAIAISISSSIAKAGAGAGAANSAAESRASLSSSSSSSSSSSLYASVSPLLSDHQLTAASSSIRRNLPSLASQSSTNQSGWNQHRLYPNDNSSSSSDVFPACSFSPTVSSDSASASVASSSDVSLPSQLSHICDTQSNHKTEMEMEMEMECSTSDQSQNHDPNQHHNQNNTAPAHGQKSDPINTKPLELKDQIQLLLKSSRPTSPPLRLFPASTSLPSSSTSTSGAAAAAADIQLDLSLLYDDIQALLTYYSSPSSSSKPSSYRIAILRCCRRALSNYVSTTLQSQQEFTLDAAVNHHAAGMKKEIVEWVQKWSEEMEEEKQQEKERERKEEEEEREREGEVKRERERVQNESAAKSQAATRPQVAASVRDAAHSSTVLDRRKKAIGLSDRLHLPLSPLSPSDLTQQSDVSSFVFDYPSQ